MTHPPGPNYNQPERAPQTSGGWQYTLEDDLHSLPVESMHIRAASMPEYYDTAARLAYERTAGPAEQDALKLLLDSPTPFSAAPERPSNIFLTDDLLTDLMVHTESWAERKGERYWETQLDPDFKNNIPDQLRVAINADPRRLGEVLSWKNKLENDARDLAKEAAEATALASVESAYSTNLKHAAAHNNASSENSRPRRGRQPIGFLSKLPGALGRSTRPSGSFSHSSSHQQSTDDFMARQQADEDFARGVFRDSPEFPETASNEQYHAKGAQGRAAVAEKQLAGFNAILEATPDVATKLNALDRDLRIEAAKDTNFARTAFNAGNALTDLHSRNYPGSPADHKVFVVLVDAETRIKQLADLLPCLKLDDPRYTELFKKYAAVTEIYSSTKHVKDQHRIIRARERGGNFNGRFSAHYQPDKGIHDVSGTVTYPDGSIAMATSGYTSTSHQYTDGRAWRPPQPVSPSTFELPKGLPHVVKARYHRALSSFNANYDPSPYDQAKAQVYAAEHSKQALEVADALPKGSTSPDRDSGNVAAYYAHYLAKLPGETVGNDEIRPFGDVLAYDATYYGERGVWNIKPNGTMIKLRRNAAGVLITEKAYNPHGIII